MASKIEDVESSVKEYKQKVEKYDADLKQMEVDATKVLDEHKKAQVGVVLRWVWVHF